MKDLADQYGIEVGQTYKARKFTVNQSWITYPRTVVSISDSGNMVEYKSGNPRLASKTSARTSCRSFADWAGLSNRIKTVPHETKKPTVADLPKYRMYCEKCGCEATKGNGLRICTCHDGTGVTKVRPNQTIMMLNGNYNTLTLRHQELLDLIQAPVKNNPMEEERWERENDRVIWLMADTRRRMAEQKAHMTDPDKRPKPTVTSPRPMSALERIQQWPKPEDVPPVEMEAANPPSEKSPSEDLPPSFKIMKNSEYGQMGGDEQNHHLSFAKAYAEMIRKQQEDSLITVGRLMGLRERMAVSMWLEDARRAGATPSVLKRRTCFEFSSESQSTRDRWLGFADAVLNSVKEGGLTFRAIPRVENPNELDQGQSTP